MRHLTWVVLTVPAVLFGSGPAQANDGAGSEASSRADQFDVAYGEVYVQRDSGPLKADLYVPASPGPHPGVLVVHGGAWYTGTRAQLSGVAQMMARRGLTAVAISYRLAPKHKFPAQIEDCKEAVRWIRRNADRLKIAPQSIGGFGYSAGAHLVALMGTTDVADGLEGLENPNAAPSTRLQAVAGGGAPCDFRPIPADNRSLAFWLGGSPRQVPHQYRLASPAHFVTSDDPPMFFFHGETDRLVPRESPEQMVERLRAAGVPAEMYIVPKSGHMIAVMDRTSLDKSIAFLGSQLRKHLQDPTLPAN